MTEKEYEKIMNKIEREKRQRRRLEGKIKTMKDKAKMNDNLIQMQLSNDQALKMETQDKRNLMLSSPNYTTHPDFCIQK